MTRIVEYSELYAHILYIYISINLKLNKANTQVA